MCGVAGLISSSNGAFELVGNLILALQHRGQDASGILSFNKDNQLFTSKSLGLVSNLRIEDSSDAKEIKSTVYAIGHTRYSTSGDSASVYSIQPFFVSSPVGIAMSHNGNLLNYEELKDLVVKKYHRYLFGNSDSELIINIFAHHLESYIKTDGLTDKSIVAAVKEVFKLLNGSYSVVMTIVGYGLIAFRDQYGIRPLVLGEHPDGSKAIASESTAITSINYNVVRDISPGELVIVGLKDYKYRFYTIEENIKRMPCAFEFGYLAQPDSVIDGIAVRDARANLSKFMAEKIKKSYSHLDIDIIVSIPDSGRIIAMCLAEELNIKYVEGFVRSRYVGRTFIMSKHSTRVNAVCKKLQAIKSLLEGKKVMLVDDSIVRGTTITHICSDLRRIGVDKIYFVSILPKVLFPNLYGISLPNKEDLLANTGNMEYIKEILCVNELIYQDVEDMHTAIVSSKLKDSPITIDGVEDSTFTGNYITCKSS